VKLHEHEVANELFIELGVLAIGKAMFSNTLMSVNNCTELNSIPNACAAHTKRRFEIGHGLPGDVALYPNRV